MQRIVRSFWGWSVQALMFAECMAGAHPIPADAGALAGVCTEVPSGAMGIGLDGACMLAANGPSQPVTIRVTPYAWLTSFAGSNNVCGIEFDADLSFREVLEESDTVVGLMGALDVELGALVFQFNGAYTSAEQSDSNARAIGLNGTADAVVESTMGNTWLEFLAGYRFIDQPVGEGMHVSADAFAGLRYTRLSLDLSVVADAAITLPDGDMLSAGIRRDFERDREWFEPFVGARSALYLGEGWSVSLRGDVGGFGVSGSTFAWQIVAAVGHEWSFDGGAFGLFAGYRALGQDYDDGGFGWDVITHGPLLGMTLRFDL